jgi:C4-dicarboxylate transporter DctQ subunit
MQQTKKIFYYFDLIIKIFEKYLASSLMIAVFLLLVLEIVTRYFLRNPLTWPEELTRFCFIGLIYFSISYAASENAHIRLETHLEKLPIFWEKLVLTIADLFWVIYDLFVISYSLVTIKGLFRFVYTSSVLRINMAYMYMIIPTGFLFMTIRVIQNAYKRWQILKENKN